MNPTSRLDRLPASPALRLAETEAPSLRAFLDACPSDDQEALAQMIDADGRARLARGERVQLRDYLAAMPRLREMPTALDAAIDMSLRWLSGRPKPTAQAVETLAALHPDLAGQIRDAAYLATALWSTDQTPQHRSRYSQRVPCDFGEPLPDGRAPYRLIRQLGSGSTGEVFLAEDTQLSEADAPALVAIKALAMPSSDRWTRRRLVEEAAKARRVDHPNVVRALHCGITPQDEDYVVFEFVDGLDLMGWANQHGLPRPAREAAQLIVSVARAVHAAHAVGLAHCDLKPANILMTSAGQPKVTDFGIAVRWQQAEAPRGAPRAAPAGTLAFMAPEQFRREDGASAPPADIYALGGVLFWLLTGHLPNGGTPDLIALTHDGAIGRRTGPSPRAHVKHIGRDLDAICARALAPRADQRHASAAALADDLTFWLERRPIPWRRPSIARVGALWARRRPLTASLVSALVIGAGAWAGTVWRLSAIAARRQTEAALARAAQAEAEKNKAIAARSVPIMVDRFAAFLQQGWAEQGLATTSVFQSMFGPSGMNIPAAADTFLAERLRLLRHLNETAHGRDGKPDVTAIAWQMEIAFLLAAKGESEEPRRLVRSIDAEWRTSLSPQDSIWRALVIIDMASQANAIGCAQPRDVPTLLELARRLRESAADLQGARDWGPLRALALDRLVAVVGPDGLASPAEFAFAKAELDRVVNLERNGVVPARK